MRGVRINWRVVTQPSGFCEQYGPVAGALAAWARMRVTGPIRRLVDPEDVVQETIVRAYDRFATFDASRGPFRSWLFGIANNILREILTERVSRPQTARLESTTSNLFDLLPEEATTISKRAARSEAVEKLVEKLQRFDESERKLFMFRALEGLRLDEIAGLLGVTRAALEKRWQRLVPKLEGVFAPFAELTEG